MPQKTDNYSVVSKPDQVLYLTDFVCNVFKVHFIHVNTRWRAFTGEGGLCPPTFLPGGAAPPAPLVLTPVLLVEAIESELSKRGVEAVVCLSNTGIEGENVMLLQRFDNKWQAFLNVEELEEITDGDKITVTLKPSAYSTTKVGFKPHKQNSLFPRPACMTK